MAPIAPTARTFGYQLPGPSSKIARASGFPCDKLAIVNVVETMVRLRVEHEFRMGDYDSARLILAALPHLTQGAH
jgi:hypothetical protein